MPGSVPPRVHGNGRPQAFGLIFGVADLIPVVNARRARPSPIATSFYASSVSRRQHPYEPSLRSSQISHSHSPLARSLPSSRRIPSTAMSTPTPTTPPNASTSVLSSPSGSITASGGRRRKAPLFPLPRDSALSAPSPAMFTPTTAPFFREPTTADIPSEHLLHPSYSRSMQTPEIRLQYASAPTPLPTSTTRPSFDLESSPRLPKRSRLEGIPERFVVLGLNGIADRFWDKPDTADCTVLVPLLPRVRQRRPVTPLSANCVHHTVGQRSQLPPMPKTAALSGGTRGYSMPNLPTRRGSAPAAMDTRMQTYALHIDYLGSQSSLFRALLAAPTQAPLPTPMTTSEVKATMMRTPAIKGARVIPTPGNSRPTFFVPLPDPASFRVLLRWMYWGNYRELEESMNRGEASWSGLVKNMEYLGLDDNPKRIVGKWWRKWVKVSAGRPAEANPMISKAYQGASDDESVADDGADADEEDEGDVSPRQDPEDDKVANLLDRL